METVYSQEFTLTDLHLDRFRRLKPSVLLHLVQEVSGHHAALLGAGWEALAQKGVFWAIIRHRVDIRRLPEAGERIRLETWPMPTTRTAYPRATACYDEAGRLLFSSHALWVLMDINTRAMVLPGKSGVDVPGHLRGLEIPAPGSLPPREYEEAAERHVGFSLLDRNGHMNNTYYLDWTADLLGGEFHREHPIKSIHICYLSEAREGQFVRLHHLLDEENKLHVEARAGEENTHRVFAAQVQY